ncbi:MAG: hypothetical protein WD576_02430 [Nitriliruptoraceae bacterium]
MSDMARQLVWLAAGLLAVPVLLLLTAPELLQARPAAMFTVFAGVLVAGVPGLIWIAAVVIRNRRQHNDDED